jgi:hypothetical protein
LHHHVLLTLLGIGSSWLNRKAYNLFLSACCFPRSSDKICQEPFLAPCHKLRTQLSTSLCCSWQFSMFVCIANGWLFCQL